ncbi:hypothetical protein Tco_0422727, partial [Tanacetum coccineum]
MSTFVRCVGCGEPLYGHPCRWCTCERCGNDLRDGYCFLCHSRNGDSFTYDSTLNSFDNPPDFSYPPPQPQYVPYSCELCGNDAHYGYDCPPQVPFVYNQDPCFNQNFDYFPQTSPSFPQQYPCCEDCGGPHETFQCQPMNYYEPNPCYDSNYSGFDQIEPPQFPVIHQPPQETSMEILLDRENLMQSIETFLKKFDRISFREKPKVLLIAWDRFCEIKHTCGDKQQQELLRKLLKDVQNVKEELAEDINTPNWDRPAFYYDDDDDDDDEESSIPLRDIIISGLPPCIAITPVLSTEEPVDSLIIEDEHLDTIPATESDELIKSSVENLVSVPSETEDFSYIKSECDVPDYDDSQTTNFSTFSNPLFDDSTSSDDELSHEEVIHEMSFKTYANPLFDLDKEIISSEFNPIHNEDLDSTLKMIIDSLLDEFTGELITIPPRIVNREHEEYISLLERLLYDNSSPRPPENFHANPNTIIESLPTFPIPVEDNFDFIPSHNDLGSDPDVSSPSRDRNKIYDPEICIEVESTRFLATLSPVIDTLLPFSSENKVKVFNHDVLASKEKSPPSKSHW